MKKDVIANQKNFLFFVSYTLEKLKYLGFLHFNYIFKKILSSYLLVVEAYSVLIHTISLTQLVRLPGATYNLM